jgi:hypothetical protein
MAPEPNTTTTPATSSPAQKGGKAKSAGETRVLQTRSAKAGLAVSLEVCETVDGEGFVGSLGWNFGLGDMGRDIRRARESNVQAGRERLGLAVLK